MSEGFITKSLPMEFKVNLEDKSFEGYASTFGNEDLVGDIMEEGCYRKTLAERGPMGSNDIKILWEHHSPFGMPVKMYEDYHGLYVVGKASDTQENKDRLVYMRDGVVKSMSVGFRIPEGKSWFEDDGWVRHIQEVKLYEFSPVTFPANEEAVITNVAKHHEMAMLVKSIGKDKILKRATEIETVNVRDLDAAISALTDVKTQLFGTEEDKRALKAQGEPDHSTPPTQEPPGEDGNGEVKAEEIADLFDTMLTEISMRSVLVDVNKGR